MTSLPQIQAFCPDCGAERKADEGYCWLCGKIFQKFAPDVTQPMKPVAERNAAWSDWNGGMIALAFLMGFLAIGLIMIGGFVPALLLSLIGIAVCIGFFVMSMALPGERAPWWTKILLTLLSASLIGGLGVVAFVAAVLESCKNYRH